MLPRTWDPSFLARDQIHVPCRTLGAELGSPVCAGSHAGSGWSLRSRTVVHLQPDGLPCAVTCRIHTTRRSPGLFYLPWEEQSFKQTTNKRSSNKVSSSGALTTTQSPVCGWCGVGQTDTQRQRQTEMDTVSLTGGEEIDSRKRISRSRKCIFSKLFDKKAA